MASKKNIFWKILNYLWSLKTGIVVIRSAHSFSEKRIKILIFCQTIINDVNLSLENKNWGQHKSFWPANE